jgi:hypothetical protein
LLDEPHRVMHCARELRFGVDLVVPNVEDRSVEDQVAGYFPKRRCTRRRNDRVLLGSDEGHGSACGLQILNGAHVVAKQEAHREPGVVIACKLLERIEGSHQDHAIELPVSSKMRRNTAANAEAYRHNPDLVAAPYGKIVDKPRICKEGRSASFPVLGR